MAIKYKGATTYCINEEDLSYFREFCARLGHKITDVFECDYGGYDVVYLEKSYSFKYDND